MPDNSIVWHIADTSDPSHALPVDALWCHTLSRSRGWKRPSSSESCEFLRLKGAHVGWRRLLPHCFELFGSWPFLSPDAFEFSAPWTGAVTGDERHCKIYLKHSEKAVEIASNVHFINTAAINKKLFIEQLDQSCDSFFVATLSVRHYDVWSMSFFSLKMNVFGTKHMRICTAHCLPSCKVSVLPV